MSRLGLRVTFQCNIPGNPAQGPFPQWWCVQGCSGVGDPTDMAHPERLLQEGARGQWSERPGTAWCLPLPCAPQAAKKPLLRRGRGGGSGLAPGYHLPWSPRAVPSQGDDHWAQVSVASRVQGGDRAQELLQAELLRRPSLAHRGSLPLLGVLVWFLGGIGCGVWSQQLSQDVESAAGESGA